MTQTMAWAVGAAFLIAAIIGFVTTPCRWRAGSCWASFP
jgi:hypothetical protein